MGAALFLPRPLPLTDFPCAEVERRGSPECQQPFDPHAKCIPGRLARRECEPLYLRAWLAPRRSRDLQKSDAACRIAPTSVRNHIALRDDRCRRHEGKRPCVLPHIVAPPTPRACRVRAAARKSTG